MTASLSKQIALRPYQIQAQEAIVKGFKEYGKQLAVKPTGCHEKGHPILMADGSIRKVDEIGVGDLVMGPDSRPRVVQELHRGVDEMFEITPVKGDPFIVNAGHVLRLRRTRTGKASEDKRPWFCDIGVADYLQQSGNFRHQHKIYRVRIEFPECANSARRIDPYILGILLGDGSLHQGNVSVSTPDPEIVEELIRYAQWTGSRVRKQVQQGNQASSYFFKGAERGYANEYVRALIRELRLDVPCESKFVPAPYKTGTREDREKLLAGLLDTDGYLGNACYEYSSKSLPLANDVLFVARSLGLAAYLSKKIVNGETYYRISISGDCSVLPLKVTRKRAPARLQIKDVLVTGFAVESVGAGEYFGFSLDGDQLYVDGSFTVHHNSGKTILFASLAQHYQPRKTLVLAHREELISQAVDKIHKATGMIADVEMADYQASLTAPVVVASVQTLMREKRRSRWPRDHFGLVVIDEAHHTLANSYLNTLHHFDQDAHVLGVTATPDRGDKKNLGRYYENIAFEITLLDLIKQNWLSPIKVKTVPLQIDLDNVRTTAGDYNAEDLGNAIEPFLSQIADVMLEHRHRKTIVFLPLIALSNRFAQMCRERGIAAEHVDGQSVDRSEILARFSRGETTLLANAMLLTEGYDEPSIDCVVCLRPTKVRGLYSQIVGRGTRIWPGKDHLLVLDFLWLTEEHNLVRPANLVAQDMEEADAITEALGEEGDLEEAREDVVADRTRKLQERLKMNSRRHSQTFDALEFAVSIADPDIAEYVPTMGWHYDPLSPKQSDMLLRNGIDPNTVRCKGQASAILQKIFLRRDLGLATAKQVRWLRKMNHPNPEFATFEEASEFLNRCFARVASA